jgi:hypothetical protein
MMMNRRGQTCLKQDVNPQSQHPSDQDLCLRPHGYWDRHKVHVDFLPITVRHHMPKFAVEHRVNSILLTGAASLIVTITYTTILPLNDSQSLTQLRITK